MEPATPTPPGNQTRLPPLEGREPPPVPGTMPEPSPSVNSTSAPAESGGSPEVQEVGTLDRTNINLSKPQPLAKQPSSTGKPLIDTSEMESIKKRLQNRSKGKTGGVLGEFKSMVKSNKVQDAQSAAGGEANATANFLAEDPDSAYIKPKKKSWREKTLNERLVLDPRTPAATGWDVFMMLMLVQVILFAPYEVAFVEGYSGSLFKDMTETQQTFYVMNLCVDLLFLIDIFVNMFTMYYDDHNNYWEERIPYIFLNYLKSWMIIDIVCIFPFDLVMGTKNTRLIRMLKFLRIIKMVRAIKASTIVNRMFVRYEINQDFFKIVRNVVTILVSFHLIVCVWKGVGSETNPDSWIVLNGLVKDVEDGESHASPSPEDYYITIIQLVMFVGELDLQLTSERFLFIITTLVVYALAAVFFAEIMDLIANLNEETTKFKNFMNDLNEFMRDHNFPQELRESMREYFQYRHGQGDGESADAEKTTLLKSLSPKLLEEVGMHMSRQGMGRVHLFKDVRTDVMVKLTLAAQSSVFIAHESIYAAGTSAARVYMLLRGALMCDGRMVKDGDVCGEVSLLSRQTLYTDTVVTTMYSSVAHITREAVETILVDFPAEQKRLRRKVLRSIGRKAVLFYAYMGRRQMGMFNPFDRYFTATVPPTRVYAAWCTFVYLNGSALEMEVAALRIQRQFRNLRISRLLRISLYKIKTQVSFRHHHINEGIDSMSDSDQKLVQNMLTNEKRREKARARKHIKQCVERLYDRQLSNEDLDTIDKRLMLLESDLFDFREESHEKMETLQEKHSSFEGMMRKHLFGI